MTAQVMSGLACNAEVHSRVLATARSIFLRGGAAHGSTSFGLLGSIRSLAGHTRHPIPTPTPGPNPSPDPNHALKSLSGTPC